MKKHEKIYMSQNENTIVKSSKAIKNQENLGDKCASKFRRLFPSSFRIQ